MKHSYLLGVLLLFVVAFIFGLHNINSLGSFIGFVLLILCADSLISNAEKA